MKSQREQVYDLSRLVDAIVRVDGVVGIILFGSAARGDLDEYSDYDLLVLFTDEKSMWSQWDKLYEHIGELRLLVHIIPKTVKEFRESTEPTFLESILKDGKILYMKYPLEAPLYMLGSKSFTLITFSMASISQKGKMSLTYRLYGKGGRPRGVLSVYGGRKIRPGCILIPTEHTQKILEVLKEYKVKWETIKLYTRSTPFSA
ncbi:MAG: nucleotidyltransferase domain-containing protein [Candidatus Bathyarchaeia archaeon]